MRSTMAVTTAVVCVAILAGCRDPLNIQPESVLAARAAGIAIPCPSHSTFVVSDEPGLIAALTAAHPNDTIAIRGTIAMSAPEFDVTTDSLTLTCGSPARALRWHQVQR